MKKIIGIYKQLPLQVKATFVFFLCSFLQKGISFITTPIFTRILSTVEYGQFSVFNSWMQVVAPIISLNLYSGVYSQGLVKFECERNKYSSSLQGLSLILISIWFLVYLFFENLINEIFELTTLQMILMFLLIWTNTTYSFWSMDQRVDFKYKKLAVFTVLVSVTQPIVCILLIIHSNDKVTARILGMVIVQLLCYAWTFFFQLSKEKMLYSKKYWIYALQFNVPLLPHYLSLTILNSSDRIMISNMVSAEKAGIYNLAYSVSMIMTMFNSALLQTIEPWIYKKIKQNRIQDLSKVAYPSFLLIAGVNLLLILFAPEIISVFAPEDYYEAIWVIPAVTLSVFFMFLYTFFATFEFYYEKTKYVAFATIAGALLNIVLNYILIKVFGYLAAGYTTLFSYILFAGLHYGFMRKICRKYMNGINPYSGKVIFLISFVSVTLGLSCLILYLYTLIRYFVIALIIVGLILFRNKWINFIKSFIAIRNDGK